jgi:glycosyltransferase involved in cell wall biosynthesis
MNVALLHDSLGRSIGGVEAWLYHAAETLEAMGHRSYAVATSPITLPLDAMPPRVQTLRVEPRWGPAIPGLGYWLRYHGLSKRLGEACTDAEVFWSRSYMMTAAALRIAAGRPVIFIQATPFPLYRQIYDEYLKLPRSISRRLRNFYQLRMIARYERLAMEGAFAIVHQSVSRSEEILAYYGEQFRGKCHIIPPGVNLDRFSPGTLRWRGEGALRTVSVCRLSPEKNIACLVKASALLKTQGVPVESVVVGEGPQRESLRALAADLGVTDRLSFLGRQEDVARFYREAHLFVLPSTYEGFGNVYLEAMASGLPCVAIRRQPGKFLVAADEVIEHEGTGLLIDDNSPELLGEALLRAYRNPEELAAWAVNARRRCETRFTWSATITRLLAISRAGLEKQAAAATRPERSP